MIIETVKVVKDSERGWHIINKCDFDPEKHTLFDESAPTREEMKAFLKERELEFPNNIKTHALVELYNAEKDKLKAE